MDIPIDAINADLTQQRPITSLAHPGDINKQVAKVLLEKVGPDMVAETIHEMMVATRPTRDGEVPDGRQREAGVKLWLAYMVGLPVQRTESVTVELTADAEVGMRERLRHSPSLRASLRAILDEIEGAIDV